MEKIYFQLRVMVASEAASVEGSTILATSVSVLKRKCIDIPRS